MKIRLITFLLCVFTLASLSAFEAKFSGSLSAETGIPFANVEKSEIFTQGTIKANGELFVHASDDITFYGKCQGVYDMLGYQVDSFDLAADNEQFGLIFKEAWLDYTSDWWALRVGRQINSWGKADVISVVDVLCPKNYTAFSFFDTSDAYLGIDGVRLTLGHDVYSLDMYWIPFVRSSIIPMSETHPLYQIVRDEAVKQLQQLSGLTQFEGIEDVEPSPENCEYAFKASAYWKYADVSLYGFYGWDRIPQEFTVTVGVIPIPISFQHNRVKMLGADASIPIGDFVVRLEGAFFKDIMMPIGEIKKINMKGSNGIEKDRASAVCGIDWIPGTWIFSAQYGADLVFGDTEDLFRDNYEQIATLAISKRFFRDTLTISAAGILYFEDWNNAFIINGIYNASDDFSICASVYQYTYNSELPMFEDYNKWGGFTVGVKYSF